MSSRNAVAVFDAELARKQTQAELRSQAAPKKVHEVNKISGKAPELPPTEAAHSLTGGADGGDGGVGGAGGDGGGGEVGGKEGGVSGGGDGSGLGGGGDGGK